MTTQSYISLDQMIIVVQSYIFRKKGVQVQITTPKNDRELQLLGFAYDVAVQEFFS